MPAEKPVMTPEQRRGVETVGVSLLMSAAAGSGKTRVLAERCAYLVCEAPAPFRCDVNELLVVTFTEAAAAEMRDRIGKALESRAHGCSDARLEQQRLLLDQAQISTLHSFCSQLLRQHFHLIGLDPAFSVMDEQEAALLRLDVGRALVRERYAAESAPQFQQLLDGYAEGDDERLLLEVFRIHALTCSLLDPQAWIAQAIARVEEGSTGRLTKSDLGHDLIALVRRHITDLGQRCNAAATQLGSYGGFEPYIQRVQEVRQICRHLYTELAKNGLDAVREYAEDIKFEKLPSVSNSVPNKEVAKEAVDGVLKEFKEGPWRTLLNFSEAEWQDGLVRILPSVHELLDLVNLFEQRYQEAKTEARQLDFADLERLALKVLLADPNTPRRLAPSATARHYHHIFKHVLVDEYQDINELQNAILTLVSHEKSGHWALGSGQKTEGAADIGGAAASSINPQLSSLLPNLFSVGDVKQSIYRFRLADPQQFIERQEKLRDGGPGGEVIDLRQNFRSRGPLLEAVNEIFTRLMTKQSVEIDYDQTQRLVPGRAFADAGGMPVFPGSPMELHLLVAGEEAPDEAGPAAEDIEDGDAGWDRTEREAAFVAQRILQITGKEPAERRYVYDRESNTARPATYRDIVILLRSKRYKANQFVRILESFDIPTHAESGTGFFESTEVRDLVVLLRLLENRQQDLELVAYLRSPLARLGDVENSLAAIRIAYADTKKPAKFHTAVARYASEKTDALAETLRALLAGLDALRHQANRQPVHETIWAIFEQTGYLAYVTGLPGGQQRSANLMELYERARNFGSYRRQGLGRFLDYLQALEADSDLGQPSVASDAQNVVRIMTVHGAKGLEFPIVILPDIGKRINLRDQAGSILIDRALGVGLAVADQERFARYPSLAQVLVEDQIHRKAMAEELRVLYVALTRAMEHLILVGTGTVKAIEGWQRRWSDHHGPLPETNILGARTLLDWLGPVWAAVRSEGSPCLELFQHTFDSLNLPQARPRRAGGSPLVDALRHLKPLDPAPPLDAAASRVIERLTYVYPFEKLTKSPAASRVTALAKRTAETSLPAGSGAAIGPAAAAESLLDLPAFMAAGRGLSATDVGAATHAVLQHLRFASAATRADLEALVAQMVTDLKLPKEQAARVDLGAIEWFLGSEIGRMVRENEPRVIREMPVCFTAPASEGLPASGLDATMVRGRIDLFVPLPSGDIVVDYKTDRLRTDEQVEDRANGYRLQLHEYAAAIGRITGRAVAKRYLVFLTARRVVEV